MQFAQIPGLRETKERLTQAVQQNHLAHALLFHGPEGSASLAMPLALATYLYCENRSEEDSCGTCSSCQRMAKLVVPDFNFVFPRVSLTKEEEKRADEINAKLVANFREFCLHQTYGNVQDFIHLNHFEKKKLNISVGAAREVIRSLSLSSFEGSYKIMMIWGVEYLNIEASNALLKILEEPQPGTIFMLVTSQPDQLLTTILSRTQKINVRAFSDEEIQEYLVETGKCDEQVAKQISMIADGNIRAALRMVDQVEDRQVIWIRDWFRLCGMRRYGEIFDLAEKFQKTDLDFQRSIFQTGLNVAREILLQNANLEQLLRTQGEDRDFVHKIATHVLDEEAAGELYEKFNQAIYHIDRNGNPKLIFTDLSMDILKLLGRNAKAA
ncbi:DNA polymerase III subunit delta' [Algoriphagus kandeliae]|uniref:DNA polymerase III subunit delta n=1 Tax=Algoriphagus kandeliae TaxID=2562278 RepID=A0A4Y9QSR2_9BACT|nr:DNA polymerase III subunit delta' [Algoriphagus kandeliae]TFV94712.1 DNA polymerase III subunit delta' [Algoriphagus kandeliae]